MSVSASLAGSSEMLTLVHYDGKQFGLISPRAFAPGTPMRLTVNFTYSVLLELKCIGSARRADGLYQVRARATTLTREAREALEAAALAGD